MIVYIATKFENTKGFNKLKDLLVRRGHEIAHDWTKESAEGLEYPERYAYLQKCAGKDALGVVKADALVFIPVHDRPMVGAYVELGMAIAECKRVIVVDAFNVDFLGKNNIFWFLPEIEHVPSIQEAADLIGYAPQETSSTL